MTTADVTIAEVEDLDGNQGASTKPLRPWYSGFCGTGPECGDGRFKNKAGEPVRHCRYEVRNGEKAARPVMYCACACHADPERAGQAVDRS